MPTFFICYRREDTAGYASWLSDSLRGEYGKANVFIDVQIPGGSEFPSLIERAVCACDIVIALIGPNWLSATYDGQRRLDDPKDFLRLELLSALAGGRRIIPVLVDRATLPKAAELPEPLRPLLQRQAAEMTGANWHHDLERLFAAIEQLQEKAGHSLRSRSQRIAASGLLVAFAAWGATRSWSLGRSAPTKQPTVLSQEPTVTLNALQEVAPSESATASLPPMTPNNSPPLRRQPGTSRVPSSVQPAVAAPVRSARVRRSLVIANDTCPLETVLEIGDRLAPLMTDCFERGQAQEMNVIYDIALTARGQVEQVKPRATSTQGIDDCAAALLRAQNFGPTLKRTAGEVSIGWTRAPGFSGFSY
jgi:hypothetical protein